MEQKDTADTGTDATGPLPSQLPQPTPPDKSTEACGSRSPSPEVRGCDLFVGNVPYTLSEAEVSELFRRYGRVSKECLLTDKRTGYRKGCAFVSYETYEEARHAHHELGRLDLDGRRLRVDWDRGLATKQQQWKEESELKAQRRALFAAERSRSHHYHSHRHNHHHHHHKHKHSSSRTGSKSSRSGSGSDESHSGNPERQKSHSHHHRHHRKSHSRSRSSHSHHHHHRHHHKSSRSPSMHNYSSKTKEVGGVKKDGTEKGVTPKPVTRSKSSSSSSSSPSGSSSKSTSPYAQTLVIPDY